MADTSVVVRDLAVSYRIYQGQRRTLRRAVANRFREAPTRVVNAVRGVSFTVRRGEAVGVVGRNGSGKSTLLRAVAGLLPPDAGSVHAADVPVLLGVAAALQQELTGRRNIMLGATALGLKRRQIEERLDDIIEFTQLGEFIDLPLRAYSSGMVARLQFAIATAVRPEIILVDEALAVGDAAFQRKSEQRLRSMLEDAGTVFLVSHSLTSIRSVCTRVLWMDHGLLRLDSDPDTVIAAYLDEVDRTGDAR